MCSDVFKASSWSRLIRYFSAIIYPFKERDRRSGPVSQILPSLQSFLLIQLMTKVVRNTIP
ncbi:hypothetical protein GCWU000341_02155 [Oribacterium sp. oral taxon 078 str. F0262]|nr:hypothetical protein GCWU000341_02155 [Oribacterium sp. oral taxon 078 str. F0262]